MSNKPQYLNLSFWKKDSGNALTHVRGLTKEQLEKLQQLKEGDRLILFKNDKEGDTQPDYTLQIHRKSEAPKDAGGL